MTGWQVFQNALKRGEPSKIARRLNVSLETVQRWGRELLSSESPNATGRKNPIDVMDDVIDALFLLDPKNPTAAEAAVEHFNEYLNALKSEESEPPVFSKEDTEEFLLEIISAGKKSKTRPRFDARAKGEMMSQEIQHTPGPWKVFPPDEFNPSRAMVGTASGACAIYDAPLTRETEANARLIAAAPETTEALRELHAGLTEMIEEGRLCASDIPDDFFWLKVQLERAGPIVAKATGQSLDQKDSR